MKFRYDPEKNAKLLAERGIGFEEIIEEVLNGNLLDIVEHHNKELYPHQKILLVKCLNVVYQLPYVIESNGTIFLKTLFPSRKATKKYLESENKKSES